MLTHSKFVIKTTTRISSTFKELKIVHFLNKANITQSKGISTTSLFQLVFLLNFQHKTWFQSLCSKYSTQLPGKDCVYRFLSRSTYNWRKFLSLLSAHTISLIDALTHKNRVKCFIIDDSPYNRNRSKKLELFSKIYDHVSHSFLKGYHMLTLGWSDGASFIPIDFAMVATVKRIINHVREDIDKRSCGFRRRKDAIKEKPVLVIEMLKNALNHGISADYVLMDSWFTSGKLMNEISKLGLHTIGMLKHTTKVYYTFQGKKYTLEKLFPWAMKYAPRGKGQTVLCSIMVQTKQKQYVKIIFVQNRKNKDQWLAIASTDTTLSPEEIIRIYGYRWQIEVFFKYIKSELKLEKEYQVQNFDSIISHTTIVYTRYIFLSWERRINLDPKTLGLLFQMHCDDMQGVEYITAIQMLLQIIEKMMKYLNKEIIETIDQLLLGWKSQLPKWLYDELGYLLYKCQG